jgi:hypothetical protein
MARSWVVRIVVDTGGRATADIATAIQKRLSTWPAAHLDADADALIHITTTTERVKRGDAQDIATYLEAAIRSVCRECRREDAVVQLTAVE